ncbi:MAG: ABC transporter permease [Dehalococcoidia bacterium]
MIGNIVRKEFKELFTLSTLLPMVVVAIVYGSVGQMIGSIGESIEEKPVIGIVNIDDGELADVTVSALLERAEVIYQGVSIEEGLTTVKNEDGVVLLVIPEGFSQSIYAGRPGEIQVFWIMRGAGQLDFMSSGAVEGLIQTADREISRRLIEEDISLDPSIALNPTARTQTTYFKDKVIHGVAPSVLGGMLISQSVVIPVVVMMLIIMAGVSVISSMGLEKENKTLETLLTLPVKRSSIVIGKIFGSALVGMIAAGIYMIGFSRYMRSFRIGDVDLADFGLGLTTHDYLLVGISLFVALLAGLSLCIVLGTFAKNYKSAQGLIFPITTLAMISMFMIMLKDFHTLPSVLRVFLFAIPFSHPMMAIRSLMVDDYALVIGGIAYGAVFTGIMIAVAVRIFSSDRLLTGSAPGGAIVGRLVSALRRQ